MQPRTTSATRFGAVLGCAIALAACSGNGDTTTETTELRFGLPTNMGANNSPMAVAEHLGYFSDEGLDVEIVVTGDSTSIVQGISSGSLEIGSTPPEPILQALTQGTESELIYNYIRQQTGSVAVLADSPIQTIADFQGATIGQASLGTSNLLLSNGILAEADLVEDVDFQHLAVGTGAAALQALVSGEVDALSLWDTEYAAFEASGVELRYFTTAEVESLFSTTYFANPAFVADNAEAITGFGRAMAKATLFTATNPEAALRIMYTAYPDTIVAGNSIEDQLEVDLIALERRIELLTAGDPAAAGNWGEYSPESIEAWASFAYNAGIVETPVDTTDLAPNRFVEGYNDFDNDEVIEAARNWSDS